MNYDEIQNSVNDIVASMLAKGMREPDVCFTIRSNSTPYVYLKWKSGISHGKPFVGDKTEIFSGSPIEAISAANDFIAKQPNADLAKLNDFLTALGEAIDLGKQHGIDADYLNPLVSSMKKLSENVITHQS